MAEALVAAKAAKDEKKANTSSAWSQIEQGLDSFATVAKVLEIVNNASNMAVEK